MEKVLCVYVRSGNDLRGGRSPPVRLGLLDFMSACPPPLSSCLVPPLLAGPQRQALDRSVPRLGINVLPDLNREIRSRAFPAGPQPQRISKDIPGRMPEDMIEFQEKLAENMPDRMPEGMAEDVPDRMLEELAEDMPDRMPERSRKNDRRYAGKNVRK